MLSHRRGSALLVLLGVLAAAGADVTLVARGAQHDALKQRGLILEGKSSGRPDPIRVRVCRPGEEKPPYDLIVVGLKSHQIAGAAPHMVSLLAQDGMMLLGQNGLPYWYFEKLDSPLRGSRLTSVDPEGVLARTIPIDAVIGGVMNKPADLVEPGRIRLADQPTDRLVIGELDNAVIDVGRLAGVATPYLEVASACAGLINRENS